MATSITSLIPAAVPASVTKFGTFVPDAVAQLQQGFYQSYRADFTLTSAQVLALKTTAVTLLAAPGAGLMYIPEAIIIRVTFGGAQLTDAGGAVQLQAGSMAFAISANTVFTGPASANQVSQAYYQLSGLSTAAAPSTNINAALQIAKITNDFGGSFTGTTHITVFYTIENAA